MADMHINTGAVAMDHVLHVLDGFKSTMAVVAACKLEIFDHLEKSRQITAAALAERCEWDRDATERLLNAMASLELVRKELNPLDEYEYSCTDAGRYLVRNSSDSIWDYSQNLDRFLVGLKKLPEEVKSGANKAAAFPHHVAVHKTQPEPEAEVKGQAAEATPHGHGHQHHHHGVKPMTLLDRYQMYEGMGKAHINAFAKAFDLSHHKQVVDLGGGSGTLAFELSRVYPNMKVDLFDVPVVIDLVQEHFIPSDKDKLNVRLVPGDFFENDIPEGDLYILSKIVHDWSTDQTTTLLKKVAAKLKKGGGIILMEKCLNDTKDGPITGHVWDLLVMGHCAGRLRSAKEYRELLSSVGFENVQIAKTQDDCTCDVIYGRKA